MPSSPEGPSAQESFKNWRNDTFLTTEAWRAAYNANPAGREQIRYGDEIKPEMSFGGIVFYFVKPQEGVMLLLARSEGLIMFSGEYSDRLSAVNDIEAKYPGATELQKLEEIDE